MKQRNIRSRATAWLLAALMVMGAFVFAPVSSFADDTFSDTASHWAKSNIEYMVEKEILSGYPDGTFRPNNTVTRAEFIKMLDATFGLRETIAINYSDVSSDDWFYSYVQQAAAQGYLLDYGAKLDPNGQLNREEAAALLARYLNLSPDNKAAPGTFPDYMDISSQYRDYVLQCVAAGILKGYDDGEFKPQRTLTRAEALAILYRSAGTIYRISSSGTDGAAAPSNASVTSGNITVSNANLQGSVYVTEGASSGTVTFTGCNIRGTLFLRGTTKLVLDSTTANNIVVMSADDHISGITLTNNSNINDIRLDSAASLYLSGGTRINNMTVGEHAEGSLVDGSGSLQKVDIRGARFVSNIIPVNYTISGNLTATINGAQVTGSDVSTNGLAKGTKAALDTTGTTDILTVTPDQTSVLFYYYTNTATTPTSDNFSSAYNQANSTVKGYHSLENVKSYSLNLLGKSIAVQYEYVVISLYANQKYFTPILLSRSGSATDNTASGFAKGPTVNTNASTGYDNLSFTTTVAGYVFYYYTTSNAALTPETFTANWNAAGSGIKNPTSTGIPVVAGTEYNQTTVYNGGASSQYQYVAVMLASGSGANAKNYPPVIVTRNAGSEGDYSASGFTAAPVWSSYNGNDTIKVSPKVAGTMRYYYTNSSQAPTTQTFNSYYGMPNTYFNSITVSAGENTTTYLTYMTGSGSTAKSTRIETAAANSAGLSYIALQLSDNYGNTYPPLVIPRSETGTGGAGFTVSPTITVNNQGDFISFTPAINGIVYWYYSKTSSGIDASNFLTGYNGAVTSVKGATTQLTAGQAYNNVKTAEAGYANSYTHIVIAIQDTSGKILTPAILPRLNTNTGSYGFSVNPTVSINQIGGYDTVSFTPSYAGVVHYYYTNSPTAPNDYNTFNTNYDKTPTGYKGVISVAANNAVNTTTVALSANANSSGYQYVTFMLTGSGTTTTYYSPYTVKRGDPGNVTGSGFTAMPNVTVGTFQDYFTASSTISGTVYWYYTNSATALNSTTFWNTHQQTQSPYSGTFPVNTTGSGAAYNYASSYNYVAFMLVDSSNNHYVPVVVARTATGTGTGIKTGPVINQIGNQDNVSLTTNYSGTLYFYYSATHPGNIAPATFPLSYSSYITVTANTPVNFNINIQNNSQAYIVFMLVDNYGTKYNPFAVQRTGGGSGVYNNGFINTPNIETSSSGNNVSDKITFRSGVRGTLYYAYSNNTSMSAATIASANNKQTVNSTTQDIQFTVTMNSSYSVQYQYVWFVLTDGVTYYDPVRVARSDGGGSTPSGTGFDYQITKIGSDNYIVYTPSITGTLYWYVSSTAGTPSASTYMYGWASAAAKGSKSATKDTTANIQLKETEGFTPDHYIVIQLVSTSNTPYTPISIKIPNS